VKVPFADLGRLHSTIRADLDTAISRVVERSSFVGASAARSFEDHFAAAHDASACAGVGSGTDALTLCLRALGVGPGDEVIVPSMTFVASAEAVAHVGATPIIADVDATTLLLSPATVDAARTPATLAVIPVHLYGHQVPFDALERWRDDGLLVIEDAAQSHLGTWQGRPVGSVGHAACFSFYPGKNLGALGDGGAVISRDTALVDEVRRIRDHGRTSKYEHEILGWCSRLDGLQAAVLDVKLAHLAEWTAQRQALAATYAELLDDVLVPWDEGAVHHLLVGRFAARDRMGDALTDADVGWGIHYPIALSQQPWLRTAGKPCPAAEQAAAEVLSLPMDPLMTDDEVEFVVDTVRTAAQF
jgi:dTDP-4-amino-4,6-dideoxygalactose transaminase